MHAPKKVAEGPGFQHPWLLLVVNTNPDGKSKVCEGFVSNVDTEKVWKTMELSKRLSQRCV